jgi:hypothetical protein
MDEAKRPGAPASDRAGEIVLGGTLSHTMPHHSSQRYVKAWRVDRWLGVERLEAR